MNKGSKNALGISKKKIAEIERLNRLFVGRELRMKELKERIRELERKVNSE